MASTKLILRPDLVKKAKGNPTTIYIAYCHNEKTKRINTGQKISFDNWDPEREKVKDTYKGHTTINAILNQEKGKVDKIIGEAHFRNIEPTFEYVEQQLSLLAAPVTPQEKPDFFKLFEEFIKETASLKAHGTNKHYKSTLNHIRKFVKAKRIKISLDRVGVDFYSKFVNYLLNDLTMSNGTANNQIKRLKVFLSYLSDKGIYENTDYEKFKLLKLTETDITYLTKEELDTLYLFDLSKNERLERVRDLLVLASTTGLRHSDFSVIRPENIKGEYLLVRTQKTKDPLRIPLNSYSSAILQKYEGKIPKLSQQKFNDYVKEVGKVCGIDEPTEITKYIGSKRVEKRVPKYELLSSHTGRRTFVTQSLERGMNAQQIMSITGHKDVKTMMKYVKITDTVKQVAMSKAWSDAPGQMKVS
jgi:site-specific recombinase XerD